MSDDIFYDCTVDEGRANFKRDIEDYMSNFSGKAGVSAMSCNENESYPMMISGFGNIGMQIKLLSFMKDKITDRINLLRLSGTMACKISGKDKKLQSYGINDPLDSMYQILHPKRDEGPGEKNMKKIKAYEAISVPDGVHKGVIAELTYKDKPYEYLDVGIELKGEEPEGIVIKASYPCVISDKSALGRLLERFGKKVDYKGKEDIDPEEHIKKGTDVDFQTTTVKKEKGEFSNIILDSVKPSKV